MASLFVKTERGREVRMMQVILPGGHRRTIRLGNLQERAARRFLEKVEALVAARHANQSLDLESAKWVGGLSDEMHATLARLGFFPGRAEATHGIGVGAFGRKHIDQKRGRIKPRSIELLEQTQARLEGFFGSPTTLDRITPDGAQDWRASMLASGLSEATTRLHTRNARCIFNGAVERELLTRNPFRKLPSGAVAADRSRYICQAEIEAVLCQLADPQWRLFVGLARYAGLLVPSETLNLSWEAVDLARGRLGIHAPKTDSTRTVPIVPRLRELFEATIPTVPCSEDRVFTISMVNRHRRVHEAIQRAGLEPWPDLFQALRRSAETDLASLAPQHAVSRWMGHGIAVSERHYLQTPDELYDKVAGLDTRSALQKALQHGNAPTRTSGPIGKAAS